MECLVCLLLKFGIIEVDGGGDIDENENYD